MPTAPLPESPQVPVDRTLPKTALTGDKLGQKILEERETQSYIDDEKRKAEEGSQLVRDPVPDREKIIPWTGGELEDNPKVREAYQEVMAEIEKTYPHAVEKITSNQGRSILLLRRFSGGTAATFESFRKKYPDDFKDIGAMIPQTQDERERRGVFTEEGYGTIIITKDNTKTMDQWNSSVIFKHHRIAEVITDAMKKARINITGGSGPIELSDEMYSILASAEPLSTDDKAKKRLKTLLLSLEKTLGRNDEVVDVSAETILSGLV